MNRRFETMTWIRRSARPIALALLAGTALTLGGCKKKAPPPIDDTPPPPPAPVEPEKVSFDAISQELKADPRVQFAADLAVTDTDMAKSVVRLADAVARGDAPALRKLVNRDCKKQIQEMENSGLWAQEMSGIEAVRVVYAAPYDSSANKLSIETAMQSLEVTKVSELPPGVSPSLALKIAAIFSQAMNLNLIADLNDVESDDAMQKLVDKLVAQNQKDQINKFLTEPEFEASRKLVQALLDDAPAAMGLPPGKMLVLLAVQGKNGAELSGWGAEEAFEGLEFNIGNTIHAVKPSASGFDGVGLAGFGRAGRTLAAASSGGDASGKPPSEKKEETGTAPGDEKKNETPEKPNGPTEKRTPSGPVQIPGGG